MGFKNSEAMIYHIFNYGVYAKQFYSFTYSNKVLCDIPQCFVFLNCENLEAKKMNNTLFLSSFKNIFSFFYGLKRCDKIIFHSYNHPYLYFICLLFLRKMSCASWLVWGADLYFYRIKGTSLKYIIYESLRRKIIPRFAYILTDVKGDYILAKNIYHVKGDFINTGYCFYGLSSYPIKIEEKPIGEISFLLGNSADPSNRHIEMLDSLAPFVENNIKIYMPLSYGGNATYVENVMQKGKALYGDKFIPLVDFLPYDEYMNLLYKIDVMFAIQERQQAQGNIWVVLSNGGKVYMNSNVTTFSTLMNDGINVFDYSTVKSEKFEEIVAMPCKLRIENSNRINSIYSVKSVCQKWLSFYQKLQ